jgi:hypothetical protein
MLESARAINPSDRSEAAVAARRVESIAEFHGLRIWVTVTVEKGSDGYEDKNVLHRVLTPKHAAWRKLEQLAPAVASNPQPTSAVVAGGRPPWA